MASPAQLAQRAKFAAAHKKGAVQTTGSFQGKSNELGHGGRSAQLKAKGVPAGVIGELARKAQAAPGQKNYHGTSHAAEVAGNMAMTKDKADAMHKKGGHH